MKMIRRLQNPKIPLRSNPNRRNPRRLTIGKSSPTMRSWSNVATAAADDTNQDSVRCPTRIGNLTSKLRLTKELEKSRTLGGVIGNLSLVSLILLGFAKSRSTSS